MILYVKKSMLCLMAFILVFSSGLLPVNTDPLPQSERVELPRAGIYAIPGGGTLETDLPLGFTMTQDTIGVSCWQMDEFDVKTRQAARINGRWQLQGTAEVDGTTLANVRDLERIREGDFTGALFLASSSDTGEIAGLGLDTGSALAYIPDKKIFILEGTSNITSMAENFTGTLDTNGYPFHLDNDLEVTGRLSFNNGTPYLKAGYTLTVNGITFSRPARDMHLYFRLEDTAETETLQPDSIVFFRDSLIGVRGAGLHIAIPGVDIGNKAEVVALPTFRDPENTQHNDARAILQPPLPLDKTVIRKGTSGQDAEVVNQWLDQTIHSLADAGIENWPPSPGTGEVFSESSSVALKAIQHWLVQQQQLSGEGKEKADGTFGLRTNRAIAVRMVSGRIELPVSELIFEDGKLMAAIPIDFLTIPYQEEEVLPLDIRAVVDRIDFTPQPAADGKLQATLLPGIIIPDSGGETGVIDCSDLLRWLKPNGNINTGQVELFDHELKTRWGLSLEIADLEKAGNSELLKTLQSLRAQADKAFEATRLDGEPVARPVSRPVSRPAQADSTEKVAAEELYARNRQINTRRKGFASEYNRPVNLNWVHRKFPEWERKVSFQLTAKQIRQNNPYFFDPAPDLKHKGVHVAESNRTKTTKYYTPLYGKGEKIEWYKVRTMEGTAIIQQNSGEFKVYDIYKKMIPMTEKNMGGATAAFPLVTFRSVAVNTKKIKPGTWLYVEFYPPKGTSRSPYTGWYEACDHGGAMRQSWNRGIIHVDIFSGVGRNNYLNADRSVPQRAKRIVYYDDGKRH